MRLTYLASLALVTAAIAAACSASSTKGGSTSASGDTSSSDATSGSGGAGGGAIGGMGGQMVTIGAGGFSCDDHCSADGKSIVDCSNMTKQTCAADESCTADVKCVKGCEAAKATKSSVGCEYYAERTTFGSCFAAFIANTWNSDVTINVEANGMTLDISKMARIPSGNGKAIVYAPLANGKLAPKQVAILFLNGNACPAGVMPSGAAGPFHITTSAPVVAYDIDPYGGGSSAITSATLLIPTSAWDTNYVAVAPWPFGPNSQNPRLTIIAGEDNTKITISPTADIISGTISNGMGVPGTKKGVPATYTLNKAQTLRFEQQAELTGSIIQSDKAIGVLGSSGCINIDACCCDGAHQQIPPVRALGSEYVAVRYRNRVDNKEESPPWRIVGAVDGTTLSYDPAPPAMAPTTLASGQVVQFRSPGPFVVKSQDDKHPFYLSGHMTGGGDFNNAGDPEFVNVVPAQQYLNSYVFFADPTYPETNLVVVRAKDKDMTFKDVKLDCAGNLTGWQNIGKSNYQYTRIDLVRHDFAKQGNCDNGRREMTSDANFGLTVWGWGTNDTQPSFQSTYVSYAYPAGASIQAINDVIVPPNPK